MPNITTKINPLFFFSFVILPVVVCGFFFGDWGKDARVSE
jgi:hypothetical protein